MKNQDMNDQQAFEMVLKLITERAGRLIISGESIREYIQNGLVYEQMVGEARRLNELVDYLQKRLDVDLPSDYERQ